MFNYVKIETLDFDEIVCLQADYNFFIRFEACLILIPIIERYCKGYYMDKLIFTICVGNKLIQKQK